MVTLNTNIENINKFARGKALLPFDLWFGVSIDLHFINLIAYIVEAQNISDSMLFTNLS